MRNQDTKWAACLAHLLKRSVVSVYETLLQHPLSQIEHLWEVVTRVGQLVIRDPKGGNILDDVL